jgi:hypothetical protein
MGGKKALKSLKYPTSNLGQFDTNYNILKNVEIFKNIL